MRTVKEVARLTGVSVRTLQYYDEIGVFRPTRVTDAGYRLYDDESLNTLQQVLFFKELDFSLKDIRIIMETPGFNKIEAFQKQKALLKAKRDRLDRLLDLLDRLEKGETCMSFKEFDLSEYLHILEQFRNENMEEVIRHWGSVEEFDQLMERIKDHESSIAQDAIKYYGSVEAYVEAMKDSMEHFSENMEKMEQIKEKGYVERNQILIEQLLKDLSKDPGSKEIQDIIGQMMNLLDEEDKPDMDLGENYWDVMIDSYLHNSALIENMDKKYGKGASVFMGKALSCYMETSGKCHRKTREL
ncbi:MerR family transcriptional regulator [Clostridium sp. FS41]|uniref:MerR family transcriptional regulator n=1 Tax=Clostridia TaxID=186801 RepID=UPI0005D330B5|nr:MerR family transcriptional regulator [Clostridium sp. FS41]KJJ66412.1 HTH-type transcriptional activator mta [Clostridium sp. FS41]